MGSLHVESWFADDEVPPLTLFDSAPLEFCRLNFLGSDDLIVTDFDRILAFVVVGADECIDATDSLECCRITEVAEADCINGFPLLAAGREYCLLAFDDFSLKLDRNEPARRIIREARTSGVSSSISKTHDTESFFSTTPLIIGDAGGETSSIWKQPTIRSEPFVRFKLARLEL